MAAPSPLTGAVLLDNAELLSEDDLQRGVVETFVQESVVLDRIPFLTINGNAYAYNEEAGLPGVAFRGVNEGYDPSTGTVNQKTETLYILGGDADVDTFIVKTRGNLNNQRAIQTAMKVKAASYQFQDTFINGDATANPKEFDGLKTRLTGAQVLDADVAATVESAHDFMDILDELVASVQGDPHVLYANRKFIARLKSLGRRVGGVELLQEDFRGKRAVVWNGIPVLDLGQTPDGADVIPTNEPSSDATPTNDTTSVYAVRFGANEHDKGVTGLTNGGVDVRDLGELNTHPAYRTRIEFFCGMAVFGGKAAARLKNIKLP